MTAVTDPIADMLTRIRNGLTARHDFVLVPWSNVKVAIARILKEEGFIADFEIVKGKPHRTIKVHLRYRDRKVPIVTGIERVSKPGLRVYTQRGEIPRVYGGLGVAIMSTPKGIMTGRQAYRQEVGGEVLCYVW